MTKRGKKERSPEEKHAAKVRKIVAKAEGMASRTIANRIVGEGTEDPKVLVANPANWRTHGEEQREAMREVLGTVGWVQRVIVNRRTGRLIDGHMRVEEAAAMGEGSVPVVYIDVEEREEAMILATLDPVAALAGMDGKKLAAILEGLDPKTIGLQKMIADLEGAIGVDGSADGAEDKETLLDQAVQLEPGKEYVVIVCENEEEFADVRTRLGLRMVRRGGYKRGSPFDDVGVERVISAKRFVETMGRKK